MECNQCKNLKGNYIYIDFVCTCYALKVFIQLAGCGHQKRPVVSLKLKSLLRKLERVVGRAGSVSGLCLLTKWIGWKWSKMNTTFWHNKHWKIKSTWMNTLLCCGCCQWRAIFHNHPCIISRKEAIHHDGITKLHSPDLNSLAFTAAIIIFIRLPFSLTCHLQ